MNRDSHIAKSMMDSLKKLEKEAQEVDQENKELRLAVSITNGMNAELKRQLGLADGHCMGSYAKQHAQKERIAELEAEVDNLKSRASTAESYGAYVSGKLESTRRQRYDRITELEAEVERLKSDLTAATNSINNATEKFGLTGEGSFTDQLSAYFNEKVVSRYVPFGVSAADSLRQAKDIALYHATGARPQLSQGGEIPEVDWRDDPYRIMSQFLQQTAVDGSGERLQAFECVPEYNKRAPMSYAFEPPRTRLYPKPTGIPVGIMWDVFVHNGTMWARKVKVEYASKKGSRVSRVGSGKCYFVRNSNLYPWSCLAYPGEEDKEYESRLAKDAESCLRVVHEDRKIHPSVCKGEVRFMLTNDRVEPVKVTVMQVKGRILGNGCWWSLAVVKDDDGAMWSVPVKRLHRFVPGA